MIARRTLRAMVAAVVAPAVAATPMACGDGGDRPRGSDPPVIRSAEPPRPPAAESLPPAPVPPLGDRPCLLGDPDAGIPWSFAPPGHARTLPMQGIVDLATRDSARLAARLARATDGLPSDTAVADFRGLPVVIRAAWRVVVEDGDTVFIAAAARRLPIESAPREELYTIVAHPVSVPTLREPLRVVWSVREAGPEEIVSPRDLVAAWAAADTLSLLLVREADGDARAELVRRVSGVWGLAWEGAPVACRAP